MITMSVDDQVNVAEEITRMMGEIDPNGTHKSFGTVSEALEFVEAAKPAVE